MVRFVRNVIVFVVLAVACTLAAFLVDVQSIAHALPEAWSISLRERWAVGVVLAGSVLVSTFALCFLVLSRFVWYWAGAFTLIFAAAALFPDVSIIIGSSGTSYRTGAVAAWPAVLVVAAGLLGVRLAALLKSHARQTPVT